MDESDVVVSWKQKFYRQDKVDVDVLVRYQNEKFKFMYPVLKRRYDRSVNRDSYVLRTIDSIERDACPKIAVIVLVLGVKILDGRIILTVADPTGVKNVHMHQNEIPERKYKSIIEGSHVCLYLETNSKTKSTFRSNDSVLKNHLESMMKETVVCDVKDYEYPMFSPIKWNSKSDNKVMIVSDIHCGSKVFLKQNFIQLIQKINLDPKIKYLILNGDIVDGKDVYPGHFKQINIPTFQEQYEALSLMLGALRKDITVLAVPGNHDFCRKVEPQFFDESTKLKLRKYVDNIIFLSNPAHVCIEGIYFYLNHGTGLNSILNSVQWGDSNRVVDVLQLVADMRDSSPIRQAVPILENTELVHCIPQNTNVIATGHMHNQGVKLYDPARVLVTTGAWQHLTNYMSLLGLTPSLAQGVCISLEKPQNYELWSLNDLHSDHRTFKAMGL